MSASATAAACRSYDEAFTVAAMDSTRWNAAFDIAARATGSTGAVLVRGALPSFPRSESMQRAAESLVNDGEDLSG